MAIANSTKTIAQNKVDVDAENIIYGSGVLLFQLAFILPEPFEKFLRISTQLLQEPMQIDSVFLR
jgi:hypothetical protein